MKPSDSTDIQYPILSKHGAKWRGTSPLYQEQTTSRSRHRIGGYLPHLSLLSSKGIFNCYFINI